MNLLENLKKSKEFFSKKFTEKVDLAIILGSGLSGVSSDFQTLHSLPYQQIPGFVNPTAPGHSSKLLISRINNKNVVFLQGRFHFYEGYTMEEVTYPIRFLRYIGVENLFITNASGSLRSDFQPGDLILIKDHINFMGTNPLIGKNYEEFGVRFPSLHQPYCKNFREILLNIASEKKIKLNEGVYVGVTGPSFETRSECIMFSQLNADIVGMSTVPEAIVAVHSGMKIAAISCVTNYSNIFHEKPHLEEEIADSGKLAEKNLAILISNFVNNIN